MVAALPPKTEPTSDKLEIRQNAKIYFHVFGSYSLFPLTTVPQTAGARYFVFIFLVTKCAESLVQQFPAKPFVALNKTDRTHNTEPLSNPIGFNFRGVA